MANIVSIHSFRGGTGKSNLSANVATQLAVQGFRVGVVDTDIQSPGLHVLFGMTQATMQKSLNDYLWGRATINEAAYPIAQVIANDPERAFLRGKDLWIIPSSIRTSEIARVLREGYDVNLLNDGFNDLISDLKLDFLIIDTHPGMNEETLLSVAISNMLIVLLRPDQQDFQGSAVTLDVARKLDVPNVRLVVNKVPTRFDVDTLSKDITALFNTPVIATLHLSEDVAAAGSDNVFSAVYPDHEWSRTIRDISDTIVQTLDVAPQGDSSKS
jgi:MinD-like ATPase involved in chromosome partitioning or flagellar assembly